MFEKPSFNKEAAAEVESATKAFLQEQADMLQDINDALDEALEEVSDTDTESTQ
ncbi:MAG: hypothetical protein LRY41_02250 [Candidatus Pacebacteria bacterium]|nr:hypothetical protein [Candidatus Paceibacterota bacterium]MCD8508414.1 hypothetical protein [Candidatus Paceibacterota bacterium]MCD8528128.1 hypothetical protein [Candidatus Paceibacterota bacterium]MCD8563512.1 hypothetical protein [Candidatus Paceibacterota bacterium]